jgi:hypothetical protein
MQARISLWSVPRETPYSIALLLSGHKRNKAAKTTDITATMQAQLITRSAIFSIAGDRSNVPIAAKSAVSMPAMATTRKNISIAVSDGSPAHSGR